MEAEISRSQAYRVALALNNIGVDLLERNCLLQARKTLHDAMYIIQGAFACAAIQRNCSYSDRAKVKKLHQARERLTHPSSEPTLSTYTVSLQTLCYDPNLLSGIQLQDSERHYSQNMYTFCPIRVETSHFVEIADPELESSIIVANYGIVHFLLALHNSNTPAEGRLLKVAEKCMYMAYDILERGPSPGEVYGPARLVLTLLMVSGNLQLSHGSRETLKFFQARHSELQKQIEILEQCELMTATIAAPAA